MLLRRILIVALTSVFALAIALPAALAEETVCRGSIGATTVDYLLVPSGATCTLIGTKVEGSVKVESSARLYAEGIRVIGNVKGEGFKVVSLTSRSRVRGSVQLENGQSGGLGRVLYTRINGDLQFFSNEAKMVARNNTILGNLQAVSNTGGLGIENNTIAGNLQCKQNDPPPTGGGNTAGDKEDQCANL
jgi:hypothetical protein